MNRRKSVVEWFVLALAFLGFLAVVAVLFGTPDSTAGQIAILIAIIAVVGIAERVWKSTR